MALMGFFMLLISSEMEWVKSLCLFGYDDAHWVFAAVAALGFQRQSI
jgi:hypothetical protein